MVNTDAIAQAIKDIGLEPVIDENANSVSVVYEMTTMVTIFDHERKTLSIYNINQYKFSEEKRSLEIERCNHLNEITNIGKCFIDDDGDQIMVYQSKVWREDDLQITLQEGLGCLASMKAVYIRMSIDFSK